MNLKKQIAIYSNLMYEKGYSVAQEGNISCRLPSGRIVITPTNLIKKFITERDLVEIDMEGRAVRGKRKPTSERFTHLEIYRKNPDVRAVVHAHPFYTVLATVLGEKPFESVFLSEAAMFLKNVVFAPYAKPSTGEGAETISGVCGKTNILVIDRHGSFTYGKDLQTAFSLTEILEKYCKMHYYAVLAGKEIRCLPDEEREALGKIPYGA